MCNPNQMKLCGINECMICFKRSFASHNKSQYWCELNKEKAINVRKASNKKYLFNCSICDHIFELPLNSIVNKNTWCNYCTNKILCKNIDCIKCFNKSFKSHEKSIYWSKNNNTDPREIFKSTPKKYMFKCECQHEFEISLNNVSSGNWCPYCCKPPQKLCESLECISCYNNSFASHEKAKYWSSKNEISPRNIFSGTHNKYFFNCICGHIFESIINNVLKDQWCPFCSIPVKKLCHDDSCIKCYEKSFASHNKSKFWSNNNKIQPRFVIKGTHDKYLFNCDKCSHEFAIPVNSIESDDVWCNYCSSKKLCQEYECMICFEKSFASHTRAQYWSNKNKLTPRDVFKNSHIKYLFECDLCTHTYEISLANISTLDRGCAYCAGQKICDENTCVQCFNKSFASNEYAKYWSKKNLLNSRDIFNGTKVKFIFECSECNHEFEKDPESIKKGSFCPYCSVRCKYLCDNIKCLFCFKKSFASHIKAPFLSEKNKLNARFIRLSDNNKYIFNCDTCDNEFETRMRIVKNGHWCPFCKNKTEQKLMNVLKKFFNVEYQKKFNWLINPNTNRLLPVDFYVDDLKLIIELDGNQHFRQIHNWKSPEYTRFYDIYKMRKSLENGISVIRILQEDVWNDTNNWEQKLNEVIKYYDNPKIIYIENEKKYELHQNDMILLESNIGNSDNEFDDE